MDAETDACLQHQGLESNESFKYNNKPLPAMLRDKKEEGNFELRSDSQGPYTAFTQSRACVEDHNKMCSFGTVHY